MRRYVISQNANKIWNLLNEVYVEKAEIIKFKLDINESDLYTALGWLARDKNIFITKFDEDIYISNKQRIDKCLFYIRS